MIADLIAVLLLVVFYLCCIVGLFLLLYWPEVRALLSPVSSVAASAVLPSARVGRGRSFQDTEVL